MKNRIRLNEAQLHRIIKESVNNVLNEGSEDIWNELRNAKAHNADVHKILKILHRLEAALKEEGELYRYETPSGDVYSTKPEEEFYKNRRRM